MNRQKGSSEQNPLSGGFVRKNYSSSTFQSPKPQQMCSETNKKCELPSIQQCYQRQGHSQYSGVSVESLPKIQSCSRSDSVSSKSNKRPISKSNSSESGSEQNVSDNKLSGIPVELTVSSRVEVKTRLPDIFSAR